MARAGSNKNYFTFNKGLVTEANPLTFPEGASLDEDNFDLKANGSRARRLGIDYEEGYALSTATTAHGTSVVNATDAFIWRGVGGSSTLNHVIYQDGRYLYVYNLDVASVSSATPVLTVDTFTYRSSVAWLDELEYTPVDICYGGGKAYVVSDALEPFYIDYDTNTATYSVVLESPSIRDFAGQVSEISGIETRPAIASLALLKTTYPKHYYNLRNQGWTDTHLTTYITATSKAPSMADIWTRGKDSTSTFVPSLMDKNWFGNTYAPRGHFTYSPFNMNRTSVVAGVTDDVITARPSTCCYFAGRLWMSGVKNSKLAGTVLFSRVDRGNTFDDVGKCMQEADPTSEILFELQPDDGGTISIPETGSIVKLLPLAYGIIVLAQNGVWLIRGGRDSGFTADSFSVQKITHVGCVSPKSVVEVEGSVIYAAQAGLYTLTPDSTGMSLIAQNITQNVIQKEYKAIPAARLAQSKSVYDPIEKEFKFYYSLNDFIFIASGPPAGDVRYLSYVYDRVLTFDTRISAFYKSSTPLAPVGTSFEYPYITAIFPTLNIGVTSVYESGVRFFVSTYNSVTDRKHTVAIAYKDTFTDWDTYASGSTNLPLDYLSYMETGHELYGDAMRNKDIDYAFFYFERTELTATDGIEDNQSSCMMQSKFDWSDSTTSQKWTTPQEIYVYTKPFLLSSSVGTVPLDYGFDVIVKKEKIRGTGKSIRFRFESSTGKDMRLLGWAISTSGVTAP